MSELKRSMNLFQLTMYGIGLTLGAGIYVLIGEAAGFTGNSMWISFGLGAIVAIFAGLSYAELAVLFPKAAAEYVFTKNAFKSSFIGFIVGWLTAITSIIVAATVALGFGGYFVQFFEMPITIAAIILVGILSIVNFIGIKQSAWMNTIFALVTVTGLAIIIFLGFTFESNENIDYFEMPNGISGVMLAFVLIFFAFIGFEDMANVSEEVKNPRKTLPRAIILSILITTVIYILVALSSVRILDWHELGQSTAPLADIATKKLGEKGGMILSIIALFATASTVLITLVAGARILYGMAKDGILPKILGKIHAKKGTPWIAVISIFATSVTFTFIGDIVIVANIVVFAVVITFAMVNLSVILLRYVQPNTQRPFKVPINIKKFPILPLFGLIATIYMALQFETEVVLSGLGIIVIGILFYIVYNKRIQQQDKTMNKNSSF